MMEGVESLIAHLALGVALKLFPWVICKYVKKYQKVLRSFAGPWPLFMAVNGLQLGVTLYQAFHSIQLGHMPFQRSLLLWSTWYCKGASFKTREHHLNRKQGTKTSQLSIPPQNSSR